MKSVSWNPDDLIAQNGCQQDAIARMIAAAEREENVRVRMERSEPHQVWGHSQYIGASKARFREGCIKAVESRIWPLPEKGRVLAEIHRRFDQVPESDSGSPTWLSGLASIYDFVGAWALAARLMCAGLRVSVVEGEPVNGGFDCDDKMANVEIVIPISRVQGVESVLDLSRTSHAMTPNRQPAELRSQAGSGVVRITRNDSAHLV